MQYRVGPTTQGKNKMCNFNHTTSQVRLQADTWINKGLPFGRYNYLVNIREIESKIQTYWTKTGTYVENNGKGYIARSARKNSHALSWFFDLFNGNYAAYRQAKKQYDSASMTVSEMLEYNRQLKRVHVAMQNKKTVRISAKQAKHFSGLLRDKLTAKGHKIAS
jgi:hypothetical protein